MNLVLHLTFEYFDQIERGEKAKEYRLVSKWARRIEGREFDKIILWRGYQKGRFIERPWRGYSTETIIHPHFGNEPVDVFVIPVN